RLRRDGRGAWVAGPGRDRLGARGRLLDLGHAVARRLLEGGDLVHQLVLLGGEDTQALLQVIDLALRVLGTKALGLGLGAHRAELRGVELRSALSLAPLIANEEERQGEHDAGDGSPRSPARPFFVDLVHVVGGRGRDRRLHLLLNGHPTPPSLCADSPIWSEVLPRKFGLGRRAPGGMMAVAGVESWRPASPREPWDSPASSSVSSVPPSATFGSRPRGSPHTW